MGQKKFETLENTGKIQVKGKFTKGYSGNPRGRPKGARNKTTVAAESILRDELENISRRLVQEALEGNLQAVKMVLDRILPARKNPVIEIELPKMQKPSDALMAISKIIEAVGNGEISPVEGETLARIVDVHLKALEVYDFENRLSLLEKGQT